MFFIKQIIYMDNQLVCSVCRQNYREDNVPRLMPRCGHSFCEECIRKILHQNQQQTKDYIKIICPQDQIQQQIDDKDINNFPKNISLIKLMAKEPKKQNQSFKDSSLNQSNIIKTSLDNADEEDKQLITQINQSTKGTNQLVLYERDNSNQHLINLQEQQICQLHGKPIQIVCIQDLVKICSTCAIFGSHKGHQFKGLEEISKDKNKKMKQVINIFEKNHEIYEKLVKKQIMTQNLKLLNQKKEQLIKEAKQKTMKLIKAIEYMQKKSIQKINKSVSKIQQQITEDMKIPDMIQIRVKNWQKNVLAHINNFEKQDNLEEILMFLNYDKHSDQLDIIEEGHIIYKQLEKTLELIIDSRNESIKSISIYADPEIQKKIMQYMKIIIKQKQKLIVNQQIQQKLNNISTNKIENNVVNQDLLIEQQKQQQQPLIQKQKIQLNVPEIKINNLKQEKLESARLSTKNFKSQESKQLVYTKQYNQKQNSFTHERFQKSKQKIIQKQKQKEKPSLIKKKNKLKLPQKYEKIYDSILNDQIQTVDFTNAQLGDNTMLQIMQNIKGKRIRTLKLIRNKLNDEGVDKMWSYFESIITLNLSQNFLTDAIIDKIILNLNKMPNLKTIILSQNRIKQRNVKGKVQQIKKRQIVVSL